MMSIQENSAKSLLIFTTS